MWRDAVIAVAYEYVRECAVSVLTCELRDQTFAVPYRRRVVKRLNVSPNAIVQRAINDDIATVLSSWEHYFFISAHEFVLLLPSSLTRR